MVNAELVEARRRAALKCKPKYASDILGGAWDDKPAVAKALSEVRHETMPGGRVERLEAALEEIAEECLLGDGDTKHIATVALGELIPCSRATHLKGKQ